MTTSADLLISFPSTDAATANILAGDLADSLAEDLPTAEVEHLREDPLTQDFGATLVVILATSAATELAKGLAVWFARRQDARMKLRRVGPDGELHEIEVDGQVGARMEGLIRTFLAD